MDCDFCSKQATIFLTKVEGESLKKISICESCAKDPVILAKYGLEQALTPNLITSPIPAPTPKKNTPVTCICGFTLEDIQRVGRLGCSTCYQTFEGILSDRIEAVQRGTRHTGKQIEIELTDEVIKRKKSLLQEKLEQAIGAENFETAAQLRDEISNLENHLV